MFVRPSKNLRLGVHAFLCVCRLSDSVEFTHPKRRFGQGEQKMKCGFYPSQTTILEGGTKDEMRIFEALFNGSWPKLSTHALKMMIA